LRIELQAKTISKPSQVIEDANDMRNLQTGLIVEA
jgi:hypothetical protein